MNPLRSTPLLIGSVVLISYVIPIAGYWLEFDVSNLVWLAFLIPPFVLSYYWGFKGAIGNVLMYCLLYFVWNILELKQLEKVEELIWVQITLALGVGILVQGFKKRLHELEEDQAMYRRLAEICPESIMLYSENKIKYINYAGVKDLGAVDPEEVISRSLFDFVHPNDHAVVERRIQQAFKQSIPLEFLEQKRLRLDGTVIDVESSAVAVQYQEKPALMIITKNVSERKRQEEQIQRLSNYDALTGLPNRFLLNDRLKQAIARAKRNKNMVAVLFIDLDRFKYINETLNHNVGDLLLQDVSKRLEGCVRECDTVARIGGDEFVIVLTDILRLHCMEIAKRMISALSQPFSIREHELFVTPSIGISLYPDDGMNVDDLIKRAETAMYRAKGEGKNNFQFYTLDMDLTEQMVIENALHHTLKRKEFDEFCVFYQPKLDLHTGRICGVEALVRWYHPQLGLISPVQFIPIAEETGLILPLGEWVLYTACQQNKKWQEAGFTPIRISVNLSARQLHVNLIATIERILEETNLEPWWLELEITEGVLMNNVEEVISVLRQLQAKGVTIAIDDFGTGYSSLSYLKRFPVDVIKIDQSFIRHLSEEREDISIVRAIITLCHSLNLRVVAEGVETEDQWQLLKKLRCNEIQGYVVSKPIPGNEFELLWSEQRKEESFHV